MKEGDIVRLKQPFKPVATETKTYDFGIVAGIVDDSTGPQILLRLYSLETASVYTDTFNSEAIYCFHPAEVECYISSL